MAGIGIITNPHAKSNKQDPYKQETMSYLVGKQGFLRITQNLEELKKVAFEFLEHDISILAINGGDGTISKTLSIFHEVYQDKKLPFIAILPGGTVNVLANNLKIKHSPEQILMRLLEMHSSGKLLLSPIYKTLKIANQCGFIFASGTSARFLKEFYKKKTNSFGACLLMLRLFVSYFTAGRLFKKIVYPDLLKTKFQEQPKSPPFTVEQKTLGLFCSTIERIPLGFRFFPKALECLEKFSTLSVNTSEKTFIRHLIKDFLLKPYAHSPHKTRLQTHKLKLSTTAKLDYTLDGELFELTGKELNIELGPQIQFVQIN